MTELTRMENKTRQSKETVRATEKSLVIYSQYVLPATLMSYGRRAMTF